MAQPHANVSQGRIYSDNYTCCHTEIEVANQTFYLTQSQYTDTRPTSPSTDPLTPSAWQGSHWSTHFSNPWYDWTCKKIHSTSRNQTQVCRSRGGCFTTRPTGWSLTLFWRSKFLELPSISQVLWSANVCYLASGQLSFGIGLKGAYIPSVSTVWPLHEPYPLVSVSKGRTSLL